MAYPAPVYSHSNATSTGAGVTIDIGACNTAISPPVMAVYISSTATVKIEASHDNSVWFDLSAGGFTSSVMKDLIPGIRFWRTNITVNGGAVTSSVGAVPNASGDLVSPNIASQDYSAAI
jgi:hypothetical protein